MTESAPSPVKFIPEGEYILFAPEGLSDIASVADHFATISSHLRSCRRSGHPARILLDLRLAAIQPKATADYILENAPHLYELSDKVAILAGSALQRLQVRRMTAGSDYQFVESVSEAMAFFAKRDALTHR